MLFKKWKFKEMSFLICTTAQTFFFFIIFLRNLRSTVTVVQEAAIKQDVLVTVKLNIFYLEDSIKCDL